MIEYEVIEPGKGDVKEIYEFLLATDDYLKPTLSSRVDLNNYSKKLIDSATLFVARENKRLIALSAAYVNKAPKESFGTYLCVKKEYQKESMIGPDLVLDFINYCKKAGSSGIRCVIRKTNVPLVKFYMRLGFVIESESTYPNSDIAEYIIVKPLKQN